ncbi:MAG: hypothetical protein ABIJ57_05955, partial [Pseudomonadota bacterium]
LLAGIVAGVIAAEDRYAKAVELAGMSKRLEQKITQDRAKALQEQMWRIEDRHGADPDRMPEVVRDLYRRLRAEYEAIINTMTGGGP